MGNIYPDSLDFFKGVVFRVMRLAQAYSRAFSQVYSAANNLEEFKEYWFATVVDILEGLVSYCKHCHRNNLLAVLQQIIRY
jgi:hypothetical protein